MNKISPFVLTFSKSYYCGALRSSYSALQTTSYWKSPSFYANNSDTLDRYKLNVLIPIRYYSAQPKKQSATATANTTKANNNFDYNKHDNAAEFTDKISGGAADRTVKNQLAADISIGTKLNEFKLNASDNRGEKKTQQDEQKNAATTTTKSDNAIKEASSGGGADVVDQQPDGLFKKFKKMYKEYWYVLLPVHIVTSAVWLGSFYYVSHSGVDIPALMESCGLSETYIKPLRDSKLGHVAIAYLLYKVATPIRYAVTVGGTTVSIKYLVRKGFIKPVPTKEALIQKYKDRRDARRESKN